MSEMSYVVVFPSVFSKDKIPLLISNIRKILKIKNQQFQSIRRDGDVILVEANDPVFASSAINLLFGVSKVAIARKVTNQFDIIVSEITKIGGNLLLRGERFLVSVEGTSSGFLTKDIEIAATSSIIEKKSDLEARPGTDESYDKLLYVFLTKSSAYICIYLDEGRGGIPTDSHQSKVLCCIYDELSAISCLETMKQGFSVEMMVCYNKKSELMNLIKIIVRLIPLTLKNSITLEFIKLNSEKKINYFSNVFFILVDRAKKRGFSHIAIPINPIIFGESFLDFSIAGALKNKLIVYDSLGSLDIGLVEDAKRIGIDNLEFILEKISKRKIPKMIQRDALSTKKSFTIENVTVIPGPNNLHDILDSLELEH